jgi:hypothetical protein
MHAHNFLVWRFREVDLKQRFSLRVVEEARFDLSNPGKLEDSSLKFVVLYASASKLRLLSRTAAESNAGGQASNVVRMVAVNVDVIFNFDGASLLPQPIYYISQKYTTQSTSSGSNSCAT